MARVDAPRGTFIAYSTAPGEVAQDGPKGSNSPYASALAKTMVRAGLGLENTFKETRREVLITTASKQVPWESSSITGEFRFKEGGEIAAADADDLQKRLHKQDELIAQLRSGVAAAGAPADRASGNQCDKLAASPHDHQWQGEKVSFAQLRTSAGEAVEACKRAVAAFPAIERYKYQLGRSYTAMDDKDIDAVHWFRQAAEAYYPAAMNALGVHLNHGAGAARDHAEARQWFQRAAEKGDPVAMANLAASHFLGMQIARQSSELELAKWARKSAEAKDAVGMLVLGRAFLYGVGVPEDIQASRSWLEKSANAGLADAYIVLTEPMFFANVEYDNGEREKLELLRKAAALGHRGAMAQLWNGLLVYSANENNPEARKWLAAAGKIDDPVKAKLRERIYLAGIYTDETVPLLNKSAEFVTMTGGDGGVTSSFKRSDLHRLLMKELAVEQRRPK